MIQIQNMRQIRLRIRSIANTRKITKAMEMVSASKLSKAKASFMSIRPYLGAMETMLSDLVSDSQGLKNPLILKRPVVRNISVLVVTSDTGLCGAYNHGIIKCAEDFLNSLKANGLSVITIGREGNSYFRRKGLRAALSYEGLYGKYSPGISDGIASDIINLFIGGGADEIFTVHSQFSSTLRHIPVVHKFLNIDPVIRKERCRIFEPSAQAICDSMARKYVLFKMRAVLLEAFTCEHSARMLAMKMATENADELTEQLTLARNKARQFAITKEVLEIAASAEALKG